MNRSFTLFLFFSVVILIGTSSSVLKNNGVAGYTGSPGEPNCGASGCHGGGSSSASSVSVSANPAFNNGLYFPDSTYQITVSVNAAGFSRFGFGCEILDSTNSNAGTMQTAGSGVKFLNIGRVNAVHTSPKFGINGTTFTFTWVAPSDGKVNFYIYGNAVNFNNNTSGDLPIPFYDFLYPESVPEPTVVVNPDNINENKNSITSVVVYPNPSSDFAQINYQVNAGALINIEVLDLNGRSTGISYSEKQFAGSHSRLIDLRSLSSGVYFVRVSADGRKSSQKLITVQ
jgi:hypothetical protein